MRAVFDALGDARGRYGAEAIGLYIICMARTAADVLAVLALARHGGLVDADGHGAAGYRAAVRDGRRPEERAGDPARAAGRSGLPHSTWLRAAISSG